MTITARQLMQTLATLATAARTVSGALYGATGVACAEHVDAGHALLHGHRAAVHTALSHPAAVPGTRALRRMRVACE